MAIGIVAIDSRFMGIPVLFWALLVVAALMWLVLAVSFLAELASDRSRWRADAGSPPALTAVAATGVLGSGAANVGWLTIAAGLLVIATILWLVLVGTVLSTAWVSGQGIPRAGGSFLLCVACQSVAVLAALVAVLTSSVTLLIGCLVPITLGLILYAVVATLFDYRQIATGAGDQWVAGGALAISVLSLGKLADAARRLHVDSGLVTAVEWVGAVLLAATLAWYLVLAASELLFIRPRYDLRRWATVFPLGMTCAATFAIASAMGVESLVVLAHVLFWPALAALLLTTVGALRRIGARSRMVM